MTTTTLPQSAPAWATGDTEVSEDRGPGVNPVDAAVDYCHRLASWTSTPVAPHLSYDELRVTLNAYRKDNGDDLTADSVQVFSHSDYPQLDLTAVDARRLGLALLDAADLLETGVVGAQRQHQADINDERTAS